MLVFSLFSSAPDFTAPLPNSNMVLMRKSPLALGAFQFHMLSMAGENNKVVRVVVMFVAIDMMNRLAFFERTTQLFSGNNAMDRGSAYLQILFRVCSFIGATARIRTVFTSTLSDFCRSQVEHFCAVNASVLTAFMSRLCVANLRTPSTLARLTACFAIVHIVPPGAIISHNQEKTTDMFSPHCIDAKTDYGPLFAESEAA